MYLFFLEDLDNQPSVTKYVAPFIYLSSFAEVHVV